MIGIDTNILIRYLIQDDEQQFKIANKLIEKFYGLKESIFLNNIVICEIIWVLERGYKYSNIEISSVLKNILAVKEFKFEYPEVLWKCIEEFEGSNKDFSDILIGKLNQKIYLCKHTITFDKNAAKSDNFLLLK